MSAAYLIKMSVSATVLMDAVYGIAVDMATGISTLWMTPLAEFVGPNV